MTADPLVQLLRRLDPHTTRAYVVKIISVDTTAGTCVIDPNDGSQPADVPYWGGAPAVGSFQVAFLFDSLLGVLTAGSGAAPYSDSGWVNVSISAGFAADSGGPPQVRKIGTVVYGRGGWSSTGITAVTDYNVGTIPVGFRPALAGVMFWGPTGAPSQLCRFDITTASGVIRMRPNALSSYYKIESATWLTD